MTTKINIFEQGLEEYPKSSIILGNLAMITWITLGTVSAWFLHPLAAWIYLAFAIIMVGVVLRKLVCTNCYYYGKWCSTGWGKLSALLFKKGNVEAFDTSIGVKLAPVTYGLLFLIPLILLVISVVQGFTVPKITVLILLLLVSSYSGIISRKKACTNCKMRLVCPGCAVKEMSSAQV
jgi:hypothetical protein